VRDGLFVGLACDEQNQFDLSEGRVADWVAQLKDEGMPF
jgi:flavodoxin I